MTSKVSQACAASILVHTRNQSYLDIADHNCKVHDMKGEGGCADIPTLDKMWAGSNSRVYKECA